MDMGIFEGFDYNPNDIDDEIFLSEVPLSLMKENIRSQFEDPAQDHKTDFVQTFLNKYIYSKQNDLEEEDQDIEDMHDEFISYMEDIFKEFLGVGLPTLDDISNEEQEELIHYIYRFFLINIKKNFSRFLLNYIKEFGDSLYDELPKKKDVAYLAYKKIIDDEKDLVIISNISSTVDLILEKEFTIDDFFEFSKSSSDNLELEFLMEKYDTGEMNGNFVDHYVGMVNEDLKSEITCKVKNKLLKKYTNN